MQKLPPLSQEEMRTFLELLMVLHASLDLEESLKAAYPLLCKLIAADHGAMCISRSEDQTLYDWKVVAMPERFFKAYAEIAPHDFVRLAVAQTPNRALSDAEMLPPEQRMHLERHPLVQYSRANDFRVAQIMAVKFATEPTWNGGLTLYRDKPMPFSERERLILECLIPFFANAMSNCKKYGDLLDWSTVMDTALVKHRTSLLILDPALRCTRASNGVDDVLNRCFRKTRRTGDGIPLLLHEELQKILSPTNHCASPHVWIPPVRPEKGPETSTNRGVERGAGIAVTFIPVVKEFGTSWLVLLDEVPSIWRGKLTDAQIDIAVRVAQGWINETVALHLNLSDKTVRTHLRNIFVELRISGREELAVQFRSRM